VNTVRDLGSDGIVTAWTGLGPPYEGSQSFSGLNAWAFEERDHPANFRRLVEALDRRRERLVELVASSSAQLVHVGSLSGSFSPTRFREAVLPYYQKIVPFLQRHGKLCAMDAHAADLAACADLIGETGVGVVEAFTPPPCGDLSIEDARRAWGGRRVIWVNFPETIF
jgi:hypothetical protein